MPKKLSPKGEKLVNNIIANSLDKNKTKTKKDLIIDSGYSPKSARNPSIILEAETIKTELAIRTAETLKKLENARNQAISELPNKIKKASYNHLINGIDVTTKNIQLLSGKATENRAIKIEISQEIAEKNEVVPVVADEVIQ